MSQKEQQSKKASDVSSDEVVETPQGDEHAQEVSAETDDILDEIDEVLESNAEDFVKGFIQKGGQ